MDWQSYIAEKMEWAQKHGVWNIITAITAVSSAVVGFRLVFSRRRRVPNLNFFCQRSRNSIPGYQLVITLEIRNFTGRTVVLANPFFRFKGLRPDPNARADSLTEEYEIKFPAHQGAHSLDQVEFMLRHGEKVATWIPLDSTHTDEEVDQALAHHRIGAITCICAWLKDRPKVHKLIRKI